MISRAERVRDALEIPDCDCPPMWWGEWYDLRGDRRRVKLCTNRKTARIAFAEYLREEVWRKATNTEKAFKPRGELVCVYPVCPHVMAAGHQYSLEEWGAILLELFPEDYQEPPLPAPTKTWPGTTSRVSVYADREGESHLYHPADITEEEVSHLQREVRCRRNGSLEILGIAIAGRKA